MLFLPEFQQESNITHNSGLSSYVYHFITSSPIIRSLPAAHHEEVCDYYEQRRELPLPVYHNFDPFYRRFLAFITAQYINPPITPPTVL